MSRSRKHLPIRALSAAESEKPAKRVWHRRMRRRERQRLGRVAPLQADDYLTTAVREVSDPLTFGKEGKEFVINPMEAEDALRK